MGDVLGLVTGLREMAATLGELDFDVNPSFTGLNDKLQAISTAETLAASDRNQQLVTVLTSIAAFGEAIYTALGRLETAASTTSNQALVAKLEELRTMLETRSVAETTAANTRIGDIVSILGG